MITSKITNFLKAFLFLSVILFSTGIHYCQKAKIEKILDSNLFELYDGTLIKLANIDVPNVNHPNLDLRKVGQDAFEYAKRIILKRSYDLVYASQTNAGSNYQLVYIIKDYPLELRDYTEVFLKKGFGKYIDNAESTNMEKYILAENESQQNGKGIWEYNSYSYDTLDQGFLGKNLLTAEISDSVISTSFWNSNSSGLSNEGRVLLEIIAAPIAGVPCAFISGAVVSFIVGSSSSHEMGNLGYVLLGAYLGYTFGNAAGVYLLAKNGPKDITFGETFLASAFGGTLGIASLFMESDIGNEGGYKVLLVLGLPALFSIIYANIIADDKVENNYYENNNYSLRSSYGNNRFMLSHKDLYNSKKIFEIDIFRIRF